MNTKTHEVSFVRVCFVIFVFVFVSSWFLLVPAAQEGHPLTGTWSGDVSGKHVTLALEWDGKAITGTVNPGPNASQIKAGRLTPAGWSVHLEAEGKEKIVLDGTLANLGSASRTLTGTWVEGATRTPVTLTRVDSYSSSNSGDLPRAIVYDGPKVTLRGQVTSVEWINPRVRFAVTDTASRQHWVVEVPDGATILERNGYSATTLKLGDVVTVQATSATADRGRALAASITLGVTPGRGGAQLFKLSVATRSAPGPIPRWADGQVQLGPLPGTKGYWKADVADPDTANLKAGEAVALPWARAVYDYRARTKFKDDPFGRCVPPGGPRQFLGPQGFQFVDVRTRVLVLHGDGNRNWRIISTDGRPLAQPADVVSSYYGTSVGRWDGDALVVDSVGYNEKFWFHAAGLPHTEALHLTERFTRTDLSTLKYDVTVDDPRTYSKPWTLTYTMRWIANQELQEFFCEEKTS